MAAASGPSSWIILTIHETASAAVRLRPSCSAAPQSRVALLEEELRAAIRATARFRADAAAEENAAMRAAAVAQARSNARQSAELGAALCRAEKAERRVARLTQATTTGPSFQAVFSVAD
jgi:hypothetical protein